MVPRYGKIENTYALPLVSYYTLEGLISLSACNSHFSITDSKIESKTFNTHACLITHVPSL